MRTKQVSISVNAKDLVVLRRVAREQFGGNLSALFVSGVMPYLQLERTRKEREERRRKFLEWLGPPPTPEESDAIQAVIDGRATKQQLAVYERMGEERERVRKTA